MLPWKQMTFHHPYRLRRQSGNACRIYLCSSMVKLIMLETTQQIINGFSRWNHFTLEVVYFGKK